MESKKITLNDAQEKLKKAMTSTIKKIDDLGEKSILMYEALNSMQDVLDTIREMPDDKRLQYSALERMRKTWKQQSEEIFEDIELASCNTNTGMTGFEKIAILLSTSPTIAAGLATSFETFKFGMIAPTLGIGSLGPLLAMSTTPIFDPVSALVVGTIILKKISDKTIAEQLFIRFYDRDTKAFNRATAELNKRIECIVSEEKLLLIGIEEIKSFGTNYNKMTDTQIFKIGSYMNLMGSSTQLLVNPIDALKPAYSELDFEKYILFLNDYSDKLLKQWKECPNTRPKMFSSFSEKDEKLFLYSFNEEKLAFSIKNKSLLIFLCNLTYKVEMDEGEKKIICRCLKQNEKIRETYSVDAKDINLDLMNDVERMLKLK